MIITKEIIEKAVDGAEICNKTGKSAYICMLNSDEKYIDYIIEKNNWYYCHLGDDDTFVYWDGKIFGFSFSFSSLQALTEAQTIIKSLKDK